MFKKIVLIATASLIAIAFSGCSKKPRRPNPLDTVMGQGYESGTRGTDDGFNPIGLEGDGAMLESRGADWDGADIATLVANADRGMFAPVLFQFDSSAIAPSQRGTLESAANYLRNNPGAKVILEGHCDWRGTQEYNLALGDRRAKSAFDYLITLGIQSNRLKTLSQGDLKATEGASSAQMAQERKVELLVIR
ncbi:OmpA family protein [Pelagicoccus sp. NFK12]|uniref:OmpA family protein n=1 Tax=Pelagicoccus enzymogenes TaxID=2773457 RepID=A0A927F615_9BACT|nr:OmpA family protein [Pelagicoccus enzymogenes]MBD5779078.1 OmpA family protein [Pelagicoccus enzymogenes]MDQ8200199.1 OmpA family protein [Pelagicoccus enzymogenes]